MHEFNRRNGNGPIAGLVQDRPANLYGTTFYGGGRNHADGRCKAYGGCGVAYKIGAGTFAVVHRFGARGDGGLPWEGRLVMDNAGDLLGTTQVGGAHGGGTIFKITPSGNESVIYSFCARAACADGEAPRGALVMDASGNLYGTTYVGGNTSACSQGCGTVFKLDASHHQTVLAAFNKQNGEFPSGLLFGNDGDLYGETDAGGTLQCGGSLPLGCGLIYRISPTGGALQNVFQFQGGSGGQLPIGGLIEDTSGNLFGVAAAQGDPQCSCGVVFEIGSNGGESVLHTFTFGAGGSFPLGGLVSDPQGNLYGTTLYGGTASSGQCEPSHGCGVVFEVDSAHNYSVLHEFTGGNDGGVPEATLWRDQHGNLYGTAVLGGASGNGTAFEIKTP